MNIAFDVSILDSTRPTGVEKTCRSLLLALKRHASDLPPGTRIYLLSPQRVPAYLPDLGEPFYPTALQGARVGPMWRERWIPPFIQGHKVSLYHSHVGAIPMTAPCAKIATVHELPWMEPGTKGDEGLRFKHRLWSYLDVTYADRLICVSQRTADNLVRMHDSARVKVRVIHHGVDEQFQPAAEPDQELLSRYSIYPQPYFLAVGRARTKKNLESAVRAFRVFLDRTGSDHRLILVGPTGPALFTALDKADKLGVLPRISAPGYIPESDLSHIYARADALLFLSFSEGFGMPPLEAFASGIPVIASSRAAITEVVADAACLVDPDAPLEVADALQRLCEDESFSSELVRKGFERVKDFNWDRTAKSVLELWNELL